MSTSAVPHEPSLLEARKLARKGSKNIKTAAQAKLAVKRYRNALGRFARRPAKTKLKRAATPKKDWLTKPANITRIKPSTPLGVKRAGTKLVGTPMISVPALKTARPASSVGGEWDGISLIPVISSNVASYGFDEEQNIQIVQFLDGSVYLYYDVDPSTWNLFQTAPSKGKFVWSHLRDKYSYDRVA